MVLIPEFLPPRDDCLVKNRYEIIHHGFPDEFHIVVYYVAKNECKIICRRMDSEGGWGLNLQIKIWGSNKDEIITIGSSDTNHVVMNKYTNVDLFPMVYESQKIPKRIIQTYSSLEAQSQLHYNSVMSFIEMNPDYEYHFFTDKKSREFIKENLPPRVLQAYDLLHPKAFKADLFRYCYIYKHGGCYFDHKFVCKKRLATYIQPNDENVFCKDRGDNIMFNAIIISVAQSEPIKNTINELVKNVEQRNHGSNALDVTGPMLFDRFTRHQNVILRHADDRRVLKGNELVIKTCFSGYYDKQHLRKECYGNLWERKLIYNGSRTEVNDHVIMAKPHSFQTTNQVRVALLTKSRLHRTKERIIQSSQIHVITPHKFNFEWNGNQLKIQRIDISSGWDQDLEIILVNNKNSETRELYVGSSGSNIKIIHI